jgi:DNA-binding NarL/FixJ family response regulator
MRLVVCDDHRILAESLAAALQARGHEVLAAITPDECLKAIANTHPDVCLLDVYLPGREDGLERSTRILRCRHPRPECHAAAMTHINVAVIVGQRTFADALASRIEAEPGLLVVAVAESVAAARRLL